MNRIDKARTGFLTKDKIVTKEAHTSHAIKQAFLHREEHTQKFTLPEIILGGQDGLVNVLGVILGVSAATQETSIVVVAGLAATFAESISMAAVAYTTKLAQADYYQSEYEREKWEIGHVPHGETEEIKALYQSYGFTGNVLTTIVKQITSDKKLWLKVMMEQELKLAPVDRREAFPAGIIVGISAIVGSFIPLTPYFFLPITPASYVSLVISSLALFGIGYYKAKKTLGRKCTRSGLEMMIIGMVSAFVGYVIGSFLKVPAI